MIEKKIRKILRLMKEYEPLQDYFKVVLSVYGSEIVVNLKPFDWEYYGESLDSTLDEVIKDLEEAIQEKDEEEREANYCFSKIKDNSKMFDLDMDELFKILDKRKEIKNFFD